MDHSVEHFQKFSKKGRKRELESNLRRKRSVAKSPVLKYKKSKLKSRSQSKTVTKCFPSKGHSVYKQPSSKNKFSLFSQRNIDFKSKIPVLVKKDASANAFRPKLAIRDAPARDISEKISSKGDWNCEQSSNLRQQKRPFKNNAKEGPTGEIGMIAG